MLNQSEITNKTILAADDDAIIIKILSNVFTKRGHKTIAATNGEDCIKKAIKYQPELILLDIIMPRMDGIQACKILKNNPRTQKIPIIFVTADTSSSTLQKAFESGGTDYVRKPLNFIELIVRVDSVFLQQELIKKHIKDEKLKGTLEMAGTICHELNQPLQYIYTASQLLLEDLPEKSEEHSQVLNIIKYIDKMAVITKKLMGITSFEKKEYLGKTKILDIERSL